MSNQALRYSDTGESLGTIPDVAEPALERLFPITVKTTGSGLIFELRRNRLKTLAPDFSFLAATSLAESQAGNLRVGPQEMSGMWLWQPVGKDQVVAFCDLRKPRDQGEAAPRGVGNDAPYSVSVAFVRFPMAAPWTFQKLGEEMAYDSSSPPCPSPSCTPGTALRSYNRLGHQYIASNLEGTAFILRMDELKLYRQVGADKPEALPIDLGEATQQGFDQPPALPRFWSRADLTNVMAKVETSTMPTGLYAWDRFLFVTTRIFDGTGTRWTVTKLNPETNEVLGTATIPTSANHLTIAPGPERWAFIEKGPVKGWNDNQEIPSILFVPSDRFNKNLSGDLCRN